MVCTEGKTNRECSVYGVGWWGLWDGGVCGMEMNKKSASPKKNNAYGLQDSIIGGVKMIYHLKMVCEIQNLCIIL